MFKSVAKHVNDFIQINLTISLNQKIVNSFSKKELVLITSSFLSYSAVV